VATCRQVNDRETLEAKRDIRVIMKAIVVRAPMANALSRDTHPLEVWLCPIAQG